MYSFSNRSLNKLDSCHTDLQIVAKEAIKASPYDFGITHGHRTPEEQNKLYQKGRSEKGDIVTYIDGINKLSKHNHSPALAFDIACYVNGNLVWTEEVYRIVASHILEVAEMLFEDGIIENRIVWGGNWRKYKDLPHFQI